MMDSGWLDRQLDKASREVREWPAWMREEAGIDPKRNARSPQQNAGRGQVRSSSRRSGEGGRSRPRGTR